MPDKKTKLEDLPHGKTAGVFNEVAPINPKRDFNRAVGKGWQTGNEGASLAPAPKLDGPKPSLPYGQMVVDEAFAARMDREIEKAKQRQPTNAVKLRKPVVSLENIEKAKALQEKIRAAKKDKDRGRDR